MKTPLIPTVVLCLLVGAALGFGTLVAGSIAALLAVFVLVLLITRPEQVGSYLLGFGSMGVALLGHVVVTCSRPSCQYDTSTPIGIAVFGLIAAAGALVLARAFWKSRLRVSN